MKEDINKTLEVLRNGGTFLYPTDTIWGLGCDATNIDAVKKIYDIKNREDNKSLIILVDEISRIDRYVDKVPEVVYQLLEFAEKPLTVVLEGAQYLADNVINKEDRSIGIRVVQDPFCKQLINRFRKPIVSTSANISGEPSPANFNEIADKVKQKVDYIVEHRQDDYTKAQPSGIILVRKDSTFKIIRE